MNNLTFIWYTHVEIFDMAAHFRSTLFRTWIDSGLIQWALGELWLFVCLCYLIADLSLESLCLADRSVEHKLFDEMLKWKLTIANEHINAFN